MQLKLNQEKKHHLDQVLIRRYLPIIGDNNNLLQPMCYFNSRHTANTYMTLIFWNQAYLSQYRQVSEPLARTLRFYCQWQAYCNQSEEAIDDNESLLEEIAYFQARDNPVAKLIAVLMSGDDVGQLEKQHSVREILKSAPKSSTVAPDILLLAHVSLVGFDLSALNLAAGFFHQVDMRQVNLDNAICNGALFDTVNFNGASFAQSQLQNTLLIDCDLRDTNLSVALCHTTQVKNCHFCAVDYQQAALVSCLANSLENLTEFMVLIKNIRCDLGLAQGVSLYESLPSGILGILWSQYLLLANCGRCENYWLVDAKTLELPLKSLSELQQLQRLDTVIDASISLEILVRVISAARVESPFELAATRVEMDFLLTICRSMRGVFHHVESLVATGFLPDSGFNSAVIPIMTYFLNDGIWQPNQPIPISTSGSINNTLLLQQLAQAPASPHQLESIIRILRNKPLLVLLREADLKGICLDDIDLSSAILIKVGFENSSVINSVFSAARLCSISFAQSEMVKVNFSTCQVDDVSFYSAKMKFVDFSAATLMRVCFKDASLAAISFHQSLLIKCDFRGVDVSSIDFSSTMIRSCDFDSSALQNLSLIKKLFASISSVDEFLTLFESLIQGLSDTVVSKMVMTQECQPAIHYLNHRLFMIAKKQGKVTIPEVRFFPIQQASQALDGIDFGQSSLRGANLHQCSLKRTTMQGVDLTDADISCANFSYARLERVNLTNASLSKANFSEAIVIESTLSLDAYFNRSLLEAVVKSFVSLEAYLLCVEQFCLCMKNRSEIVIKPELVTETMSYFSEVIANYLKQNSEGFDFNDILVRHLVSHNLEANEQGLALLFIQLIVTAKNHDSIVVLANLREFLQHEDLPVSRLLYQLSSQSVRQLPQLSTNRKQTLANIELLANNIDLLTADSTLDAELKKILIKLCRGYLGLVEGDELSSAKNGDDVDEAVYHALLLVNYRQNILPANREESIRSLLKKPDKLKLLLLNHSNLAALNFSNLNLSYVRLEGSDCKGCDWRGSDLSFADLNGCDLSHGQFNNALLNYCSLINADLRHTTLLQADYGLAVIRDCQFDASIYDDLAFVIHLLNHIRDVNDFLRLIENMARDIPNPHQTGVLSLGLRPEVVAAIWQKLALLIGHHDELLEVTAFSDIPLLSELSLQDKVDLVLARPGLAGWVDAHLLFDVLMCANEGDCLSHLLHDSDIVLIRSRLSAYLSLLKLHADILTKRLLSISLDPIPFLQMTLHYSLEMIITAEQCLILWQQRQDVTAYLRYVALTSSDNFEFRTVACQFAETLPSINLSQCQFTSGNPFSQLDFAGIQLMAATFTRILFLKKYFSQANIDGAKFIGSDFLHSDFCQLSANSPQFLQATFSNSHFLSVQFFNATFYRCRLADVTFKSSSFLQCNFSKSSMNDVIIENSDFIDCDFRGVDLAELDFTNASLKDCQLDISAFNNLSILKHLYANLTTLDAFFVLLAKHFSAKRAIEQLSAGEALVISSTVEHMLYQRYDQLINDASGSLSIPAHTPLRFVTTRWSFEGMDFSSAHLENAVLSHRNLRYAHFSQVDLSSADLTASDLTGAVCEQVGFIGAKLDKVCFDQALIKDCDFDINAYHNQSLIAAMLSTVSTIDELLLLVDAMNHIYQASYGAQFSVHIPTLTFSQIKMKMLQICREMGGGHADPRVSQLLGIERQPNSIGGWANFFYGRISGSAHTTTLREYDGLLEQVQRAAAVKLETAAVQDFK